MAEQGGDNPPGPLGPRTVLTTDQVRAFIDRAPRCKVRVAVLCRPAGGGDDVIESQLVNVSKTGMFVICQEPAAVGTVVAFQFNLDKDLVVLRGTAEVVRVSATGERGMGLRFVALDGDGRLLVDRIVEVNSCEPPPVPAETDGTGLPGGGAVQYDHGSLRIVLTTATAPYFTYNPLLNIAIGGCFLPADADIPIGTGYQLDVVDAAGQLMLRCKAKVAAKQERRIGVRLIDVDRAAMLRLRAEVSKLAPSG
jgi:hypothetical protein